MSLGPRSQLLRGLLLIMPEKPIVSLKNYTTLAGRTEKIPTEPVLLPAKKVMALRLVSLQVIKLGGLMDQLKRDVIYGKPAYLDSIIEAVDPFLVSSSPATAQRVVEDQDLEITPEEYRLLHAGMGLVTEAAEMLQAIMEHVLYEKPLDRPNIIEEGGDLDWYQALVANVLGFTLQQRLQANIDKLFARYGDKFSQDAALNRDLARERQILEDSAQEAPPEVNYASAVLSEVAKVQDYVAPLSHWPTEALPVDLDKLGTDELMVAYRKACSDRPSGYIPYVRRIEAVLATRGLMLTDAY